MAGYLCCGIHTRGLAALDGVLYRTTIDAHVVAINMKDGKQVWKSKAADYKQGYSMTHAPLIAGGVLITGISGGEYGTRGFINGWDLKTGEKKWTRFTTALPNEKGGDTWKPGMAETGGGPTWLTGTYDPELDLVYWGTGNGGPWNPATRGGDSALHLLGAGDPPLDAARSSGTTSSRRVIRTTTTAPTNWCWPTCRSAASRPRC